MYCITIDVYVNHVIFKCCTLYGSSLNYYVLNEQSSGLSHYWQSKTLVVVSKVLKLRCRQLWSFQIHFQTWNVKKIVFLYACYKENLHLPQLCNGSNSDILLSEVPIREARSGHIKCS